MAIVNSISGWWGPVRVLPLLLIAGLLHAKSERDQS